MVRKFYLLSVIPNQQVRLELQRLRQQLFRELGLASAQAFEPVIPLAWCGERPDSAAFARFAGPGGGIRPAGGMESSGPTSSGPVAAGPPRIEAAGLKTAGEALFLEVTVAPEQAFDNLQAPLAENPEQNFGRAGPAEFHESSGLPAPFFPVTAGIFLAAREFDHPAEEAAALIEGWVPALQSWSSSRIGLFSMRSISEPWWQHVEWALEWKIQLKQV